jgi:hypothetical protein
MPTLPRPIYRDTGKPDAAVPATNGCALPGAAHRGELTGSSLPIEPTIDDGLHGAAETIWAEIWPAAHNEEIWGAGPDGTFAWRNQADGVYERDGNANG